jgi:hypothetical protein
MSTFMSIINRKYSPYIIVVLVGIILVLLFVLVTDVHVAKINRDMDRTIHQAF